MLIDMTCLSLFCPGVLLFLYNQSTVELTRNWLVPTNLFFAALNSFSMMGGLVGRWSSYALHPRHPLLYVGFSLGGAALNMLRIPLLAPLGTFLTMLGDGLIYGSICRHIDYAIPKIFNLVAISYWLFVGDLGSILGSNLLCYVRDAIASR